VLVDGITGPRETLVEIARSTAVTDNPEQAPHAMATLAVPPMRQRLSLIAILIPATLAHPKLALNNLPLNPKISDRNFLRFINHHVLLSTTTTYLNTTLYATPLYPIPQRGLDKQQNQPRTHAHTHPRTPAYTQTHAHITHTTGTTQVLTGRQKTEHRNHPLRNRNRDINNSTYKERLSSL
jgi:hypothetical protein